MSNSSHSLSQIVTHILHNLELGHKSSFNFEIKFAIHAVCIWKCRGRYGTCYRVRGEHLWHYENVSLLLSLIFFFFLPTLLCPPYSLLPHILFSPLSPFLLLPTLNILSSSLLNILPSSSPFPLLSSLLFPLFPSPSSPFFPPPAFLRLADEEGGGMKGCEASLAQFYTWSRFLESQRGSHGVCCIRVFVMWCAVTCVQCCGGVRRLQSYSFRADGGLRRRRKKNWEGWGELEGKGGLRA